MGRGMSSYEKGLELEELITKLFKAKGYDAKHNIKLVGRSGVEHQIDVYAEYKAPLHTSKIIIECKSYDKPIEKDIVMKLIHEVQDLGADRGILVTTSYFTPDAASTAEGYNIDLWDGAKLRELLKEIKIEEIHVPANIFYIKPMISIDEAMKTVDKNIKGIFGRKGTVESSSVIFHPYYELNIDARVYEAKGVIRRKVEEKIVSATILVDSTTGELCSYDPKDGIVRLIGLPTLSEEEARAFRILGGGSLTVSALASLLSCSTAKARRIVQGLVAKGVAEMFRVRQQTLYRLKMKIPDPSSLKPLPLNLKVRGEPGEGVKITPMLGLKNLESLVNLLWEGEIKSHKTVFYPYFACRIVEEEKRYIKAVDMLTNKIDEKISRIFTALYSQLPF